VNSCRSVVSVSVVAVGLLGLSACGGDKPSGLAVFTSGASSSSSPSPTAMSKWTPEQQQVIDGYDRFNDIMTGYRSKGSEIDMAKAHQVGQEPFVTEYLKGIVQSLATGYVDTGKAVSSTSSVTLVGSKATMKTCLDLTHTKPVNSGNPSAPPVQISPPNRVTVSLVRGADSWLVAGLKGGEGTCVSG
jgi:hypothetical protein